MNNERTMNTHREGSAAGRREVHSNVMSVVMTAFFAAVIFLGTQSFRIPLPAAVGTPFLHFGHIFVMLSIVCLGGKRSAVSGVLGLIIFDILNGYLHAIPNVFVSTIIKCLFVGAVFSVMKRRAAGERKKEYMAAVVSEGTGSVLSGRSYTVAGKTGTAEYSMTDGEKTHSWFTGFTNVDNPELVITVITEGSDGSAGGKAVSIAGAVLDSYYNR